jgi:hypothetical protein
MNYETHIRIRITSDLDNRLATALTKNDTKSDFIRAAISEKIQREEPMKKIGITGLPNFPLHQWSKQTISFNDLFNTPIDLTADEIKYAKRTMDTIQLDTDDVEGLLQFVTLRTDFMSFLVHLKRINDQDNKKHSTPVTPK